MGFPCGLVVKNPPANAVDMGSIPGPGRSHMALSPCTTITEPVSPTVCAPQLEKPP